MTYIILAAGKGSNLYPLNLKYPKTSYKIGENTTILQRLLRSIRHFDRNGEIVVVLGYLADEVKSSLAGENVKFVLNPFYEVTNSIASLWFARSYLERECVTVIHADVVYNDNIVKDYITAFSDYPYVLVDSSLDRPGGYNAVINGENVLVMSKKLDVFDAGYSMMTKLDAVSARLVKKEVDDMVNAGMNDLYFEDALVQMTMFKDFSLGYRDIKEYEWTEVDDVNDLLKAEKIQKKSNIL